MTAPFYVRSDTAASSFTHEVPTFDEAVEKAVAEMKLGRTVTVYSDDYDVCSIEGFFDGLSESQRDVLEARGIS